ncbi:DUF349 domain-containing protein [Robiginitalea biformata]|uniref:DUF349 domain-containing protein n=1 Tax=Robiginitalea biformata TaxID=252307 RepID=UPI003B5CC630
MSEEENKELHEAAGGEETPGKPDPSGSPATGSSGEAGEAGEVDKRVKTEEAENPVTGTGEKVEGPEAGPADADDSEKEIDDSNAEDAEDSENERRHQIPFLDYHALSMENLVGELQRLLRTEKVQAIRRHVDGIKQEFDQKFQEFIEQKKEEFVDRGGNEADFRYNSVTKRQFNELYAEYREKRNQYYKELEQNLRKNLTIRQEIIEELKGLVNMEEDMNTTYQHFKDLQERWRRAGPVPRTQYNDVWRTYHHHVEIFYDFLHLNRELRDLDFKHNLEEKLKLIERAEALAGEPDLNKAFRELQTLHKIWKEEVGPVAKDQREAIWDRFSAATKTIHQRRQDHFRELEKRHEANLETKKQLIAEIAEIADNVASSHRTIQKQIRQVEALREKFFQAGKVPQQDNEATWSAFKGAVRKFNRTKNAYYKNLKKEQQENLEKKRALLARAVELKDSEDWDAATPEMKRIQQEWKQIGHVPRKYSDKIWKEFKTACNHYFDRLHARRNSSNATERQNLEQKEKILDELKGFNLSGKREADLKNIQEFLSRWKGVGRIPGNKKHLNAKFYKILDALFRKLGVSKAEADILKYGNKIQKLSDEEDSRAIEQERQFVRKKIEENKSAIRQLENNLEFFSDPSEDNPLVKDVIANIDRQKKTLANWKAKLKKLNILRNERNRAEEAGDSEDTEGETDTDGQDSENQDSENQDSGNSEKAEASQQSG